MNFNEWLIKKKGMQTRSAGDVESRLKRLRKISDKFDVLKNDFLIKLIEKETDSPSVRSQLKRAANLYYEYKHKN